MRSPSPHLLRHQNARKDQYRAAFLLNRTRDLREDIIGIGSNQPYGSNHQYKDDRQHHCVFSDVLALFFSPNSVKHTLHFLDPQLLRRDCTPGVNRIAAPSHRFEASEPRCLGETRMRPAMNVATSALRPGFALGTRNLRLGDVRVRTLAGRIYRCRGVAVRSSIGDVVVRKGCDRPRRGSNA